MTLPRLRRAGEWLQAYDAQLRSDAETPSQESVRLLGPLRLVTFAGGRGFVTYQDLGGADEQTIRRWVGEVVEHFSSKPEIARFEWKTRGHDLAPGLHDALVDHGLVMEDTESVMIGEATTLDVDVPLPDGVTLRRVHEEADVRAMCAMQDIAFGEEVSEAQADAVLRRQSLDDGMELWVAEQDGQVISAGRLEPVAHTEFAGLWGGATLADWRGRGIYRALSAARARSALLSGKALLHSDSTEYSRPILERAGFVKVTTTTPYRWTRS